MRKPNLVLRARLASVKRARAWLRPLLDAALPEPKARFELLVAVTEALTNIIRHGYPDGSAGAIRLCVAESDAWVEVSLADQGRAFDPRRLPARDPAAVAEGGYGTGLIRRYVDRMEYHGGAVNLLCLRKLKAGPDTRRRRSPRIR